MANIEKTVDAETIIVETIRALLARREAADTPIEATSSLHEDLGLDSLELAEVSSVLEDTLGRDPFSEGVIPETLGELIEFYRG